MDADPVVQRVMAALDALGADYEVVPCDPALADTAEFCAHYGWPPEQAANAIIVASKKEPVRYAACLVLATTRLDVNRTVKQRLGVNKASFASAEATKELTGMEIGGVTPFGLPEGLPLWVDSRVMDCEQVIVGAGSRSAKIRLRPEIFARMSGAEIVDGLANEA
jgi:prolyl-tRNA editing enzyme YbaK/EbsC (Cys-tRNA(Pro) deacylase)